MSPTPQARRRILGALAGVAVGVLLVLLIALLVRTWTLADEIREAQKVNTGTLTTSEKTLDRINDCTTPGRKCYDKGQTRTAKAVGDINRVIVLAAACADKPQRQTVVDIQNCVIAELADR